LATDAGAGGGAGPELHFDAGVVGREVEAPGEDAGPDQQAEQPGGVGQAVPEDQQQGEQWQAPVVGEALLEAELAGDEAAEQLRAPGAENGGEAEDEGDAGQQAPA